MERYQSDCAVTLESDDPGNWAPCKGSRTYTQPEEIKTCMAYAPVTTILLRSRGRSIEGASGYDFGVPCDCKRSRVLSGLLTTPSLPFDACFTWPA